MSGVETYLKLLGFFVLGTVAFVLPRQDTTVRFAPRLWLLSTFGFAHSLHGFLGMLRTPGAPPSVGLLALEMLSLAGGYIALFEFGRVVYSSLPHVKPLRAWPGLTAATLATAGAAWLAQAPYAGFVVGARCFIGVPGALLTGLSLLATPRSHQPRQRTMTLASRIAGSALVVYGTVMPISVVRDPRLPRWLPSEDDFLSATGVSVSLVRALCALTLSAAFVMLVRQANAIGNSELLRVVNTIDGFVYRRKADRDWTQISMTGGVEALCGYRADDFLAPGRTSWSSLIDPRDLERVRSEVSAALDARRDFELSYRIRARDDTARWVYERGRGVFDPRGQLGSLEGHVMNDTVRMCTLADLRIKDAAIESSLNAIALSDMNGKLRYVNRAFVELWRLPRAEDALGRSPTDFLEDQAQARRAVAELRRDGRWQGVLSARRYDATRADVHLLAHVIVDAAGEPAGMMASFIDLTEQLRLAQELKQERDFATSLIATAPVIILLLDAHGCIKHINAYGAALLGYEIDELIGKPWVTSFVPQHEQSRIQSLFDAATSGVNTRGNVNAVVTRSGELHEIEWNDQLMRDAAGQITAVLAIGLDITERKRSLEALRASQKQLREILDAMFAFVGLFSIDGRVLEVNQVPLIVLGVEREEVIGHSVWEALAPLASAHAEQQARDAFRRAAAGEQVRRDLQLRLRPHNKLITMDVAFGPVRDESGRIERVVGSAVDVTEQREAERQRLQLEAQLRQSQKLEALGTLAGGIAHDFNNVLMTIFGNAELARDGLKDPARVSECLAEIEKAGRRAQDLVQRILAFSRRQEHTLQHVSVRPVLEEVIKLMRSTLPARVELQLKTRGEDLLVMADPSQVHQVIMNLMTNAWHALGDRSGRISLDIGTESIEPEQMRTDLPPGQYVRIDVSDTGAGISASVLERIFEPFFTTKPAGQGTGLGLSVVHGIMKAHRGAITVESQPGEGTTFHVYFPAAQPDFAREEVGASTRGPARGAGEHVLYIDDEPALVEVAARVLRNMGYRVTTHTSGEHALSAFRANPQDFDVVVTDHNMPGMSGIDLAQEIAALSPRTPVILASGFLSDDELQHTLELGVAEVVMKPTTYEHLAALIRAMLDREPAKRERAEVA